MKKSAIFLVITLVFLSCRKRELPQPVEGNPVFYVACNLDGTSFRLDAGTESYAMAPSCYKDSTNVYVFRGEMKKAGCTNDCGYSISVLINDVSTANAARNTDSALRVASYKFVDPSPTPALFRTTFIPEEAQATAAVYQWTVSDGSVQSVHNGYSLGAFLENQRTYSVTLGYKSSSGCSAVHSNVYKVGNPLQANIRAVRDLSQTLAYTYSSDNTGSPPYNYFWEFNDGSANDKSPWSVCNHVYKPLSSGYYHTKLTLVDADSNVCVSYYDISAMGTGGCTANFSSTLSPVSESGYFSRITILLKAPDGTVYSSREIQQPGGSNFEIVSVEDYMADSNGRPTKKLKIKFNCSVRNGNSEMKLTNGEAVIAVAHQ
jgi:hypothetical protein